MFPPPHQCSPILSVFPPLHQYSPHPVGATPTSVLPPLHQCSPHSIGASPLHQCSLYPISGFSPRKPHLEESVWVVLSVAWFPASSLLSASLPTLVILTATAGDEERFLCSENQFLLHLQHPMPVNSGGKSFLLPVAPETTSFPFETWKVEQSSVF